MRALSLVIALAACSGAAAPHAPGPAVPVPPAPLGPIAWTISTAPSTVSMAQRATVMVTITATNHDTAARSPDRDPLDFTVDGADSMELSLAFGNGGRGGEWTSLAPGQTATDERNGMELVQTPGDHVIAIRHDKIVLAQTTLHVTP